MTMVVIPALEYFVSQYIFKKAVIYIYTHLFDIISKFIFYAKDF